MNRSKVDRTRTFFEQRLNRAIDETRLELHAQGKHTAAETIASLASSIRQRMSWMGQYERLELSDIIKGHNRAWPET